MTDHFTTRNQEIEKLEKLDQVKKASKQSIAYFDDQKFLIAITG